MGDQSSDLIRLELPCVPDAPHIVREALDDLAELDPIRDEALLIASELVTNAVIHSGCLDEHHLEVRARLDRDRVVISVDDPGIRGGNAHLRSEPDPVRGGFGLCLVQQLARRWGWDRNDGHRVWAELSLRRC